MADERKLSKSLLTGFGMDAGVVPPELPLLRCGFALKIIRRPRWSDCAWLSRDMIHFRVSHTGIR